MEMGINAFECEARLLVPAFSPPRRGEGDEARASAYLTVTVNRTHHVEAVLHWNTWLPAAMLPRPT